MSTSESAPPDGGTADEGSAGATEQPVNSPTAHRDFGFLWAGQSLSLVGDRFMVLALPLLATEVLGSSVAQAALLPSAFFGPFLLLGLPAGAIVDRLPRRVTMVVCDAVQLVAFLAVAVLAALGRLSFPVLFLLIVVSGAASVFFQVAYTSYLPTLYGDPKDLHRGNARLFLSDSLSQTLGPMVAGPAIQFAGVVSSIFMNVGTFAASILSLLAIKSREAKVALRKREQGWIYRDIREGLRFVFRHPLLEPVILCGFVYVLFANGVIMSSIVLYCRDVMELSETGIGIVLGSTAIGFPVGNLLSSRLVERWGTPKTLVVGAIGAVGGLVVMPLAGSLGSTVGFVAGFVVHGVGEGTFGPCSLTLRQTATPSQLLGRVNAVQRFFLWGATPIGSVAAAGIISLGGLSGAMWVGGVGATLCLPVLFRRGIRKAVFSSAESSEQEPSS